MDFYLSLEVYAFDRHKILQANRDGLDRVRREPDHSSLGTTPVNKFRVRKSFAVKIRLVFKAEVHSANEKHKQ